MDGIQPDHVARCQVASHAPRGAAWDMARSMEGAARARERAATVLGTRRRTAWYTALEQRARCQNAEDTASLLLTLPRCQNASTWRRRVVLPQCLVRFQDAPHAPGKPAESPGTQASVQLCTTILGPWDTEELPRGRVPENPFLGGVKPLPSASRRVHEDRRE